MCLMCLLCYFCSMRCVKRALVNPSSDSINTTAAATTTTTRLLRSMHHSYAAVRTIESDHAHASAGIEVHERVWVCSTALQYTMMWLKRIESTISCVLCGFWRKLTCLHSRLPAPTLPHTRSIATCTRRASCGACASRFVVCMCLTKVSTVVIGTFYCAKKAATVEIALDANGPSVGRKGERSILSCLFSCCSYSNMQQTYMHNQKKEKKTETEKNRKQNPILKCWSWCWC